VKSLIEMLRAKDFTYFTKETLFMIMSEKYEHAKDMMKNTIDAGIFEGY
jgi:hypothetical protein